MVRHTGVVAAVLAGAAPNPDGKMRAYATMALASVHGQLARIYEDAGASKNDGALWRMLGAAPMVGRNDVAAEVFTLSGAQPLTDRPRAQDLGSLGMWSANRDYPCPTEPSVRPDCSSAPDQTMDLAFSQLFAAFGP